MNDRDALDLSALAQFRPSDLLAAGQGVSAPAAPVHVELDRIDFDPGQPRRSFREESIEELSASICQHGVLEPVSVRSSPKAPERYIVNRGERRVRAARRAGLRTIPVFIDERIDPFAQAAENLHREDMSAFDLAQFIAEREREGISRAEIARRPGKPRSFITEAAACREPAALRAVVQGTQTVSRTNVDELPACAHSASKPWPSSSLRNGQAVSGGRTVLVFEHEGRRGSLRIKARKGNVGEVRFGDGSRSAVPLGALRLVCWATEESK